MSDRDIVIKYLSDFKKLRSDKCGASVVVISQSTNIPIEQVKIILNALFKEKTILIKQGINEKLIFLK